MNSDKEINARLLMSYPVEVVKQYFRKVDDKKSLRGVQPNIIKEVVDTKTVDEIDEFVFSNLNWCKQHIYIFHINTPFIRRKFNEPGYSFPYAIRKEEIIGDDHHFYFKAPITYSATIVDTDTNAVSNIHMAFWQPIKLTLNDSHMYIQAVISEKSVAAYLGKKTLKPLGISKSNTDDFVSEITSYFLRNYLLAKCDLNKGVKHLVDNDILDFISLELLNTSSTDRIIMNENSTFKKNYPHEYRAKMLAPLTLTSFKYLHSDKELCHTFSADCTVGKINVPVFPENINQIKNVLHQIISNN